jgi:hypothetical protein
MAEDPTPQFQNDSEEGVAAEEHQKTRAGATRTGTKRAASKKTAAAKTSVTNPVVDCSAAGVTSSGWLKVGDGLWRGWVNAADGRELEIEELGGALKGSWRCVTDETVARTLEQLLQKILLPSTRKKN